MTTKLGENTLLYNYSASLHFYGTQRQEQKYSQLVLQLQSDE